MWQDLLALLIVAIAALALLRPFIPVRLFRANGCREEVDGLDRKPLAAGGCGSCSLGSVCPKAADR